MKEKNGSYETFRIAGNAIEKEHSIFQEAMSTYKQSEGHKTYEAFKIAGDLVKEDHSLFTKALDRYKESKSVIDESDATKPQIQRVEGSESI